MSELLTSVREEIRAKYCRPERVNSLLPPERELTREFSVSRSTLRKALGHLVDDGLLRRFAGKGTFVADPNRPHRISDKPLTVGIIGRGSFASTVWLTDGLDYLHDEQVAAMINFTRNDPFREYELLREQMARRVDGLLVEPSMFETNSMRQMIHRLGVAEIPVVLMSESAAFPDNATRVWIDDYQASRQAMRYLIDRGHRHIAHVASSQALAWRRRTDAYYDAMAEAGLSVPDGYVVDLSLLPKIPDTVEFARNVGRMFFAQAPQPTAVFAYWTLLALGVQIEAQSQALRVPGQFEGIGIGSDFHPDTRPYLTMPVQTMWYDEVELGRHALKTFVARVKGGEPNGQVTIPVEQRTQGPLDP